jgi:3-phenylpropionate/trans-cinnamate dioxygenase ferredoxin reductase component
VPPAPTFVVVGASLAGGTAAATLREDGFDGRLVLIGDEPAAPYERPGLSKRYLRGEEPTDELLVRPAAWWKTHDVETRLGIGARSIDAADRTVTLSDGEVIRFDRALIATGVRNRSLNVPGGDLDGVYQLRTIGDADRIRAAAATARRAVVIGMGFIGAEVTASLRQLGLEVTVVEVFETALYRALGPTIGRVLEAIHRDNGVVFHFHDTVERFEGRSHVERVVTRAGHMVDCELVVVGIGTESNSELLRGAVADGGIPVDATLETEVDGVFAAGDVSSHDHPLFGRVRVEHFDNAIKMGQHAARGMLRGPAAFDDPHWFWSDQWEHEVQMAGVSLAGEMIVRGSIEGRSFCAFLLDDGVLRASVSIDRPRDVRRSLPLIRRAARPDPAALADPEVDLRSLVAPTAAPGRR